MKEPFRSRLVRVVECAVLALFSLAHLALIIGAVVFGVALCASMSWHGVDGGSASAHQADPDTAKRSVFGILAISAGAAAIWSVVAPVVRRRLEFVTVAGSFWLLVTLVLADEFVFAVPGEGPDMELPALYALYVLIPTVIAWIVIRRIRARRHGGCSAAG
jgi:hypothetical protein